jgi:hypothetical protein
MHAGAVGCHFRMMALAWADAIRQARWCGRSRGGIDDRSAVLGALGASNPISTHHRVQIITGSPLLSPAPSPHLAPPIQRICRRLHDHAAARSWTGAARPGGGATPGRTPRACASSGQTRASASDQSVRRTAQVVATASAAVITAITGMAAGVHAAASTSTAATGDAATADSGSGPAVPLVQAVCFEDEHRLAMLLKCASLCATYVMLSARRTEEGRWSFWLTW